MPFAACLGACALGLVPGEESQLARTQGFDLFLTTSDEEGGEKPERIGGKGKM